MTCKDQIYQIMMTYFQPIRLMDVTDVFEKSAAVELD